MWEGRIHMVIEEPTDGWRVVRAALLPPPRAVHTLPMAGGVAGHA
jgi:hypothetical protein